MGRHLLAAAVVLAEAALVIGARHGGVALLAVPAYALVVVLSYRAPVRAFAVALLLAAATGGAYILSLWAAYQAGRHLTSRTDMAAAGGAALGGLGAQLAVRPVVLTSFGAESNVVRALRGGIAGFVLKNCLPDELIRAVRAAHAGDAYLSPAVTRTVLGMVTPGEPGRREAAAERLAALTARESEILSLVAEGMSNADVGRRLHLSETTIKTYMSRILAKLNCSNRVQAALLARDAADRR